MGPNGDDGENMFFVEADNNNMPELGYGIEIIMEDFGDHSGYIREQRLADALLIAAAPELLEALKELELAALFLADSIHSAKRDIIADAQMNVHNAHMKAQRAIKKATEISKT